MPVGEAVEKNPATLQKMKTLIRLLSLCDSAPSDHGNGYYICTEKWNTCFFRWATNKTRIEVRCNFKPKTGHTYTKIPKTIEDKVFFVYANSTNSISLLLGSSMVVIGGYEPQKSGEFYNYAYLVYSPLGIPPEVVEMNDVKGKTYLKHLDRDSVELRLEMLCPSFLDCKYFDI
jgi:hypothetical protein